MAKQPGAAWSLTLRTEAERARLAYEQRRKPSIPAALHSRINGADRFMLTYPATFLCLGQRPVITALAKSLSWSAACVYFSGGN
jgi:hypothetical protein